MALVRIDKQPNEEDLLDSLADDPVGRNASVSKLVNVLCEIEGPFSIFIDSAWGDGKTFLVRQAELVLRLLNPNMDDGVSPEALRKFDEVRTSFQCGEVFFPVYFNAWENDDFNDPLLPLFATMAAKCSFSDTELKQNTLKTIAGIVDVIAGVGSFAAGVAGVIPAFSLDAGAAKLCEAAQRKDLLEAYADRIALREKFDLMTAASLVEVANKAVLFIDELDRCRPEFAIKLLEQTKSLFNNGNVIVVYSTNSVQLSHAVKGLYGASFDAEKYLERFYDLKIELPPVNSARYLRYLGFDDGDQYNYTIVANGFIRMLQPTMRDANRLIDGLKRGQRYFKTRERDPFPGYVAIHVAEGVILPTLIVMRHSAPDAWCDVQRGKDFSSVYEYGKRNDAFIEIIDTLLSSSDRLQRPYTPGDESRSEFVEMICAVLFIDDYNDPRLRKASETLEGKMLGHVNRGTFRELVDGY